MVVDRNNQVPYSSFEEVMDEITTFSKRPSRQEMQMLFNFLRGRDLDGDGCMSFSDFDQQMGETKKMKRLKKSSCTISTSLLSEGYDG